MRRALRVRAGHSHESDGLLVEGLTPGVTHDFQLMSYRVDASGAWVNAKYSNKVTGTAPTQ